MAAPAEDGAESDALPAANTVAPSVLELRAPSIRYIDPAQSNIIMESGTKSPSVRTCPWRFILTFDVRPAQHPMHRHACVERAACYDAVLQEPPGVVHDMQRAFACAQEFPPALYGCPYPAVPNGQLGQCIPPPQCNCAGGVCYGAC